MELPVLYTAFFGSQNESVFFWPLHKTSGLECRLISHTRITITLLSYFSHAFFFLRQAMHQQLGAKRSHPPRACESQQEIRTKVNRALSLGPSGWAGSITLPLIYHLRGIVSRNLQEAGRCSGPVLTPSSLHKGLDRLGSEGPMPVHARGALMRDIITTVAMAPLSDEVKQ